MIEIVTETDGDLRCVGHKSDLRWIGLDFLFIYICIISGF